MIGLYNACMKKLDVSTCVHLNLLFLIQTPIAVALAEIFSYIDCKEWVSDRSEHSWQDLDAVTFGFFGRFEWTIFKIGLKLVFARQSSSYYANVPASEKTVSEVPSVFRFSVSIGKFGAQGSTQISLITFKTKRVDVPTGRHLNRQTGREAGRQTKKII